MIRTLALIVGLAAAFGAAGYAQTMRGSGPLNFENSALLAGEVTALGEVARGSHFRVQLVSLGVYRLRFDRRYFPNGCPILTVTNVGNGNGHLPGLSEVYQVGCSRTYDVQFFSVDGTPKDQAFTFTAVGTE